MFFSWPFGGLFGLLVPFFFIFIGVRVLRYFLGGASRTHRSTFEEYEQPSLPYDDVTSRTRYAGPVPDAAPSAESYETAIFKLADEMKGRVTVSDVVIATDLGLKDAERIIDALVDGVHVSMEVTDSGRVVYEFPEIIAKYENRRDE